MPGQYAEYPASTGSGGGITSINGNTSPNQTIVGGTGISVSSTGGTTTITNTEPGTGTVTSVGFTAPSIFSVSGSPITTAGTIALSLVNEAANTVFAGPASGGPGIPTFRSLVAADIPSLPYAQDAFTIIQTPNGTSPTATSATSVLTLLNTDGTIVITGNSGANSVTLNTTGLQPTGNYITALTGDGMASGPGSAALTLATVNGSPGTFTNATVTVNAKGLVTSASSGPTPGTVSSVALADGSTTPIFNITGSPVTGSGTLTETLKTQTANTVFAGPASGAAAQPTFRALTIADEPALSGQMFITSGTTYTTPSTITAATRFKFTLIGGGGGGGGINVAADTASGGGGGGGVVVYLTGLSPSTSYTIAIGAAGTAGVGTGAVATAGGNTTLLIGATTYTANGGGAGANATTLAGTGGTGINGTINIMGQSGCFGSAGTAGGGNGGSSPFGLGLGGASINAAGTGLSGTGYGGGGGGGHGLTSTGGVGTQGCILVEWWV
jgi:hypothetical protein